MEKVINIFGVAGVITFICAACMHSVLGSNIGLLLMSVSVTIAFIKDYKEEKL
mgnify:CR=1 FL=1